MTIPIIACPYCHGICPVDARFCIECSAALQQAVTHTTHRLFGSPEPSANVPMGPAHDAVMSGHSRLSFIGPLLSGVLVLLTVLANRTFQRDSVAPLILIIGVVQFARGMMRKQIITGLRAAVIGVALVLAMRTPWILTISIVAGALLLALHLVDKQRIASHRRA
jgi:hypothetical protein